MAAWEAPGFVAVVLGPDGKAIREMNEDGKRTVRVPFGSEYSIRFKNKTNARAYVRVEIDGMDALSGKKLILPPNCTKELERFLEGDNSKGRRFQFVTANSAGVTDPTAGENGLVRVIFEPESVPVVTTTFTSGHGSTLTTGAYGGVMRGSGILSCNSVGGAGGTAAGGAGGSNMGGAGGAGGANASFMNMSSMGSAECSTVNNVNMLPITDYLERPTADLGATQAGSMSGQQFRDTNEWFPTLSPVNIDVWIRGPKVAPVPKVFATHSMGGAMFGHPMLVWFQGQVLPGVKSWHYSTEGLHIVIDGTYVETR